MWNPEKWEANELSKQEHVIVRKMHSRNCTFSKAEGKCANKGTARNEDENVSKDTTYLIYHIGYSRLIPKGYGKPPKRIYKRMFQT